MADCGSGVVYDPYSTTPGASLLPALDQRNGDEQHRTLASHSRREYFTSDTVFTLYSRLYNRLGELCK